MTPASSDITARLRAAGDTEAADEIERLKGIIRRNREAFEGLKAQASTLRDRAIRAEAALVAEARRRADPNPLADLFGKWGGR